MNQHLTDASATPVPRITGFPFLDGEVQHFLSSLGREIVNHASQTPSKSKGRLNFNLLSSTTDELAYLVNGRQGKAQD